ncbi:MAG: sulfite exporter TauE/SafE family protein [Clostridiales bacterium]|nr:sulfite exporter TauE/SafE family protein [Candidatus Apopatousia equi]
MEWLWLILIGIVGGILGGLGMGGGTLLIPLLTIFLGIEQNIAQGINLLAFLPMSLVALFIHFKNKLVDAKISWPIIVLGVLSAIGGSFLANILDPDNLRLYFGIFLIVLGVFQFVSIFIFKQKTTENKK